ncbi:OmpA family protein [Pedobacter sp.]|uniref:OmpA family protein n=1 Tax=Pedobacter sp. TaxID=1411316 RepID=UPI00396CC9B6
MSLRKFIRFFFAFLLVYLMPSLLFSDDIKDADKLYKSLDYKFALEIYEKVMQSSPSMEVAEKIANCYRFINNTEKAETWYKKALQYSDAPAYNYKYLADVLKQNGKFEEAERNYLTWGERDQSVNTEAQQQAEICRTAKFWTENPDVGASIKNEKALNSENSDFSPMWAGKDLLLVSDRWQKDTKGEKIYGWTGNPYLKLYALHGENKQVEALNKRINSGFHTGPAVVNAAADTMIFTRSVPFKNKNNSNNPGRQYLLIAVKQNGDWVVKDRLPFNSDGKFSVQHPALSPDGRILYFVSDMPGGYGGMDIYYVEKQANGTWSVPVNCGNEINTPEDDVFPSVRKDGKFYFASKGHIGMGGLDIFSAEGSKNNFSKVENLRAPLNSPKDDFGIVFNEDNLTGYLSSNRAGGIGMDDIYSFKLGIKVEEKPLENIYVVQGIAVEKGSNAPIMGLQIILRNKNNGEETSVFSDDQGKFSFRLDKEMDYVLSGNSDKYFTSQRGDISTKGIKQSTVFEIKFELEKSKNAYTITLNNIYYDFNKWNIRKDAEAELNKVDQFMNSMPQINLELVAHTDARGTAAYNQKLSEKRAASAMNYLIGKGINAQRLKPIGKGKTQLVNQCADGIKCTEAEHQLNRRTEFKIIKITPVALIKHTGAPSLDSK